MSSPKMAFAREPELSSWHRAADWIEAKSGPLAIALCLCFAGLSLAIAARRPLWCDEIITISIARAPTIKQVLGSFQLIYDQTPPLNALLVRFVCTLLGWTELVVRLPSILFATGGLLILFHRVRTLTNGLFGLLAITSLLVTFLPSYAYEGRPYALLFFASTLALSLWISVADASSGKSARRRSVFFGMALMLAVFAHYYAILLILPFVAEELRSSGLRKLLSFRLFCGFLGLGLGLAVQFPFIRAASQRRVASFWAVPSFLALRQTYVEMLLQFIFVLICVVLLFAWISPRSNGSVEKQGPFERLGWFFLGIPIAGYVLAEVITHAFTTRYFIPLLAGFGLAFGCFLCRCYRSFPQLPLLFMIVAVSLFLETSLSHLRNARTPIVSNRAEESDFVDSMLPRFHRENKLFALVMWGRIYMEARYYAVDPQILRVLRRPELSSLPLASGPLAIRYFSMDDIRQHARETAFVAPSPDLLSDLEKLGFRIHWRMTEPEPVVYVD